MSTNQTDNILMAIIVITLLCCLQRGCAYQHIETIKRLELQSEGKIKE